MSTTKERFSKHLLKEIVDRGWSQSELARRATTFMPDGKVVGRDSISKYIKAQFLPNPGHLKAIADALGLDPADLLDDPRGQRLSEKMSAPAPLEIKQDDDGLVWLRVNEKVPLGVALDVARMVKEATDDRSDR